tara:strand:+ start:659 stop:1294 length:636 start_codon:yes stop_codon:yes gene_type:complete
MISSNYFFLSFFYNLLDPNNNNCFNKKLVNKNARLVIDGFPGSGQSFLLKYTLNNTNVCYNNVIHHTHSSIVSINAALMGIPVVILLRPPDEAVYSLISRWKHVPFEYAYDYYCKFYESLLDSNIKFYILDTKDLFKNKLSPYLSYLSDQNIHINQNLKYDSLFPEKLKSNEWKDRKSKFKIFHRKVLAYNLPQISNSRKLYSKIYEVRSH